MKAFKLNQEETRKTLAKFIICLELPFCIIEYPVFKDLMRSVQPLFNVIGHKTIKNDCMTLYEEERKKLHECFKKLTSWVSFITDIWTSNQKVGYISLTAHYIDFEFILHQKIISFQKLPYHHSSFVIEDAVEKSFLE